MPPVPESSAWRANGFAHATIRAPINASSIT